MTIVDDIATITDVDRAIYIALFDKIEVFPGGAPTYYEVAGVQPLKKLKSRLQEDVPLIYIRRRSGLQAGEVVGTGQVTHVVKTVDGEGNPTSYDEVTGGTIGDISYEVRYMSFDEDDDRAITAQIAPLFPVRGTELQGPGGKGPFYFDFQLHTDVPGLRKYELGGLFRIIARHVCIGDRVTREAAAITDLQTTEQASANLNP